MQAASSALHAGDEVVWIDTGNPIVGPRLVEIISPPLSPPSQGLPPFARSIDDLLKNTHYHFTPTLCHLLALLTFFASSPRPSKASLLVVDNITSLFATAFPRAAETHDGAQATAKMNERVQWAASRRFAVMSDFLARVGKLAAMRNIAVLLVSQAMTRVRREEGMAVLRPAISTKAWEEGIANRMVLFRDWQAREDDEMREKAVRATRFVGVTKLGGVVYEGVGKVVPFTIEKHGLREIVVDAAVEPSVSLPLVAGPTLKRKREEVADSESEEGDLGSDEEFGWVGNEDLTAANLDQVYAEVCDGEPGSAPEPEGEEELTEQGNDEESEEGEMQRLIEQALDEEMCCMDYDYGGL
ncbi:hypothetical protein MMC30_002152 [Trapelia coarctata]|nr:hypothetical protein [Trapelia coarctata]